MSLLRRGSVHAHVTCPTPDGDDIVLRAHGLSKSFGGISAVRDVTVSMRRGEVLGVIGPNGAGKSTLINLLSGSQLSDHGSIEFLGADVTRLDMAHRARRGLLRTFQEAHSDDTMKVDEFVKIASLSPRARRHATTETVAKIVDDFGISAYADRFVAELPYGVQKLLNLAMVALGDPLVVLIDEPFAGVTHDDIAGLTRAIGELRDRGVAVAVVEHDIAALMRMSDRVLAMHAGSVLVLGTPDEVRHDPRVREVYLGSSAG